MNYCEQFCEQRIEGEDKNALKPFNLYKRPSKKYRYLWHVRFYDEEGNRLAGRSTGQTSKSVAETWSHEQLKRGLVSPPKDITFGRYAENWWINERCPYIQGKKARGFELSRTYANDMRAMMMNHIFPYFQNLKLQKINARLFERWTLDLRNKIGGHCNKLSNTTVNRCLTCLKIMFKEAVRLDYLHKSPADAILPLK